MKRYDSKIGIGLVLIISTILTGTSILMLIYQAWFGLIIILTVALLVIHIFKNTFYIISGNDLIIKCGLIYKVTIKIDKIKKLEETNNPLSSPAASLDRLAIYYYNDYILVSPKDKMDFISDLMKINPGIEVKLKKKIMS